MRKLGLILWLLGLAGALSMMLAPVELLAPPELGLSPLALRALAIVNPLVLMTIAVAAGCWAAPRVGLDAPVLRALAEGRPAASAARPQLLPALIAGAASALVLIAFAAVTEEWVEGSIAARFQIPLVTKLLYGGIVEELLLRWGAMSLLAWLAWKVLGARRPPTAAAYWAGIAAAALLFAAGHLPALYALVPAPPAMLVAVVLAGNTVPGLLFGLLFWRRGLEAAMAAHALAHLLATAVTGWI